MPPLTGRSVREARAIVRDVLVDAGIDVPEREARLILELALGLTPEQVLRDQARLIGADESARVRETLARRCRREPLSRIRGEREFYGRKFTVTPAVLDPRPDTETLVDCVLAWVDETGGRDRPLRILDVGTGTGCLLITLLAELPAATGLGTDVSPAALAIAGANAERQGVAGRAVFARIRGLGGLAQAFDILVSNPPYIPTGDLPGLEPEVRCHDPELALDGGADGLDIYRDIAGGAAAAVPCGLIAVEAGAGQAGDISGIFQGALGHRVREVRTRQDLGGHTRCVALLTQS